MFEIEAHAADAMAELGVIPKAAAETIWERGGSAVFDTGRIDEIERETKHDVIAFLTHVAEIVGPEARFLHQGMTSSDVNDTTLAVQLARATDLLLEDVDLVLAALKRRAFEYRHDAVRRAAATASTPSRPPSGSSSPATTPNSAARASGWPWPGSRSPPAPSPGRSAPSPASIRGSRRMCAEKLGLRPNRFPPR